MIDSRQNRKQPLIGNWLLSLASWAVPLGLTLITTPIVVGRLGTEQYGLYAVILGYLAAAFSTGVGKLSAKYIPEFRAANDSTKLSDALSATFIIALVLGGMQALILSLVAPFVAKNILLLSDGAAADVTMGLRIAALTGFVMINGQVFQFAAQGLHRFDIFAGLSILTAILANIGNVVLVVLGYGFASLLIWNGIVALTAGASFLIRCLPLLPEWSFHVRVDRSIFRSALTYAGSIVIYQGVTSILFAFERSWIVRRFGAEAVAYYVIPLMLATYLHAFLGSFVQVLFPVVNELLADKERLVPLYKQATKVVFVTALFLVASYIACGHVLLNLWLGAEFAARSTTLLSILAIAFGLNATSMIVWLLAESFKAPSINAFSSSVCSVVSIALMTFTAASWGLEGISGARLAGIFLTTPLIFFIEKRFLGRVFWKFWLRLVSIAFVASAATAFIEISIVGMLGESWPSLVSAGVLGLGTYILLLFAFRLLTLKEIKGLSAAAGFEPEKTVVQ